MALAQVVWGRSQAVSQSGNPPKAWLGLANPLWSPLMWLLAGLSSFIAVGWRLLFLTMSASPWHILMQWQLATPIANDERKMGERDHRGELPCLLYPNLRDDISSLHPILLLAQTKTSKVWEGVTEGVNTQKQGWTGTILETGYHTLHIQESAHHVILVGIPWDSQSHHPLGGHAW